MTNGFRDRDSRSGPHQFLNVLQSINATTLAELPRGHSANRTMKVGDACRAGCINTWGGVSGWPATVERVGPKYVAVRFDDGNAVKTVRADRVNYHITRHDPGVPLYKRSKGPPEPRPQKGRLWRGRPADGEPCSVEGVRGAVRDDLFWPANGDGPCPAEQCRYARGTVTSVRLVKTPHQIPVTVITAQ